ncbi:MAG: S8/S53 family peptidase [Candidatus Poseidoniaceae archaeon]|nr:S8/S53 family peptidase [Candidatus Poseidoniaceae archaeon]
MAEETVQVDTEVSLETPPLMEPKTLIAVSALTFLLIFSFFALALTGDSAPSLSPQETIENDGWRAFSVVAPVDTGINVYHDHFRTNETYPSWLLDGLGVNKVCDLTFEGSWQERYDADKDSCWDTLVASDIVYFPGTKIIGSSPDGDSEILILDDPSDGHGSAVTGSVLNANPQAVIFFVEGFSTEAVIAAANQPLVDVISTSFGAPGSVPISGIERGTEIAVVEQGKMHTGAADNSPSPAIQDSTAGPPWSIGIAGYAEEGDDQKEIMSGSYPDISADWTQNLPNHDDIDGYHETSGTSFATPRTAGILSFVLESLRSEFNDDGAGASPEFRQGMLVNGTDADGNSFTVSNADVREALNRSAWYPDVGWDPTSGTMPISPVAPCTQTGWGLVNLSNIEPMIAHLNQSADLSERPGDVVACMNANQDMREAYWNAYPSVPEQPGELFVTGSQGAERRFV